MRDRGLAPAGGVPVSGTAVLTPEECPTPAYTGPAEAISGHRGFGAGTVDGYAENTPASLLQAVAEGCGWLEVDARLNADGSIVSYHHATVGSRRVADLTDAECVRRGMSFLPDLLDVVPDGIGVNIDVKTTTDDALLPWGHTTGGRVEALLTRRPVRGPMLVSSFDPSVSSAFNPRLRRHVQVGLLGWKGFPFDQLIAAAAHLRVDAIVFHHGAAVSRRRSGEGPVLRRGFADDLAVARHAGLQTISYVPPPDLVGPMLDAGLDCACVDDIPAAVAVARARG